MYSLPEGSFLSCVVKQVTFKMEWSDERFITTFISTDVRPLKEKAKQTLATKMILINLRAKQIVSNEKVKR